MSGGSWHIKWQNTPPSYKDSLIWDKYMKEKGFTLFELVLSIAIIGLLTAIGIPSFSAQIQSTQTKTATELLVSSINLTRTKAVSMNRRVTMLNRGSWSKGWDIFVDNNNDGKLDGGDLLIESQQPLDGVKTWTDSKLKNYFSYIGAGYSRAANNSALGAFQAGSLKICNPQSLRGYKVILANGGRARTKAIGKSDCSF